uniref:Uncharacterized protein n=1 Tax=Ananas comosus var. bracteatus TaxID=296719 RepID=A0A6V7Q772_ANACO|nr:unnamed protein product [Ananas comosus var. bracteatus]
MSNFANLPLYISDENHSGLYTGTRLSSYPQIFPTVRSEPNWTGLMKSENNTSFCVNMNRQPLHLSENYNRERRQFPFLQELGLAPFKTVTPPESSKMFSDCALSLLSSSPAQQPSDAINSTAQIIRQPDHDQIPIGQPLLSSSPLYGVPHRFPCSQAPTACRRPGIRARPWRTRPRSTTRACSTAGARDCPPTGLPNTPLFMAVVCDLSKPQDAGRRRAIEAHLRALRPPLHHAPLPPPRSALGPLLVVRRGGGGAAPSAADEEAAAAAGIGGGVASLLLGASLALMLCGSVTFVIGFILMPWVVGLLMVFYFVGIVSNLSGMGRAILCPNSPSSPKEV